MRTDRPYQRVCTHRSYQMRKYSLAVVAVTRGVLDNSCWNKFHRPRNDTYVWAPASCSKKPPTAKECCELQRSGCDPRAVPSTCRCCMERAATGVCWFTAVVLATCLQYFLFCVSGFNGEVLVFCRQVLKLRLRGLSTRAGSRAIRTATTYDYRVHS